MDLLKILRKGQSVSQYNKTKSKRDQYSCQKKMFSLKGKKKTLILLSHKFVWKPLKRVERCPFFEAFYSCGIITQYNGSPSFQPGLWYINLKMSLLNTKKDFSLCFHFPLVLFHFLWAKISWRKKTFLLRLVQTVLPPQRNEYREGRKYKR